MATIYNSNINRDQLVFYADAGNQKSYVTSDPSSWDDLTSSKYPGEVRGTISHSNGSMVFSNNVANCIFYGNILEMGTSNFTCGIWTRISNFSITTYQGLMGRGYFTGNVTGYGIAYTTVASTFQFQDRITAGNLVKGCNVVTPLQTNTWYYIVGVRTYNDYLRIYLNGKFENDSQILTPGIDNFDLSGGTQDGFRIGSNQNNQWTLRAGEVVMAHINRKALTDQEILRNYNNLKWRFGL